MREFNAIVIAQSIVAARNKKIARGAKPLGDPDTAGQPHQRCKLRCAAATRRRSLSVRTVIVMVADVQTLL